MKKFFPFTDDNESDGCDYDDSVLDAILGVGLAVGAGYILHKTIGKIFKIMRQMLITMKRKSIQMKAKTAITHTPTAGASIQVEIKAMIGQTGGTRMSNAATAIRMK